MEQDFFGRSCGKFPEAMEQLNRWCCFFPDGLLQTEIPVLFWHLFQAFAAVFRLMELICANGKDGKRDSGTKFSLEFSIHLAKPRTDRFTK